MSLERKQAFTETINVKNQQYWPNPKISVIVPVYRVEKYLTQCLNSIVNQTMSELEIIIVDEGELDRCREIIDFFEANDPRIVTIHQKNGGYGASCNLGMDIAKGEYLAFVESDDFIELEMFEEMYEYAKQLDADLLKTPFYDYYSDGMRFDCVYRKLITESLPAKHCFSAKEFGGFLHIHASLWSCIYKNSYMKEKNIRFVEAKGAGYVDCNFRVDTVIQTNRLAWLDKPYYNHRVDAEGSSTNNFRLKVMLQRWKEVHESMTQEDYLKYYGPYLIIEEFYSSLCKPWMMKVTKEEYELMAYNLSFSTEEMIKNSPVLDPYQRRDLLELKLMPEKFKRRVVYQRVKNKFKNLFENMLNTISNPVLLFWLFIGFITSVVAEQIIVIPENISTYMFGRIFLICIYICFTGKLVRKVYSIILNVKRKYKIHIG